MHARGGPTGRFCFAALLVLTLPATATRPAEAQSAAEATPASGSATASAVESTAPAQVQDTAPKFEPDPFIHLFQNTFRDLKAFASVGTALTLGAGGGTAAAGHAADGWITDRIEEEPARFWDFGGNLGTGYLHSGAAAATYVIGRLAGSPKTAHVGTDLLRAQVLSSIVTHGLKRVAQRQRPGRIDGASYSFPSGHTTSAFATSTVLWRHFGWKVGAPATAVGAWIAAGRVHQGEHFLSDVLVGAAVGIAGARTVTLGHGTKAVALVPTAVRGGVALMVTPAH